MFLFFIIAFLYYIYNMVDKILDYIEENSPRFLQDLKDLIRFETVTSSKEKIEEFKSSSEFLVEKLKNIGFENVQLLHTLGNPIVYGDKIINDKYETLLFYAHYDVQPAEPLDLWQSDPFVLQIKDGYMYGRGVADDKGMLMSILHAFEYIFKNNIQIKYNIKILFEPSEESCSHELEYIFSDKKTCKEYVDIFKCDTLVSCDSAMSFKDKPSITVGTRGCLSFEVTIYGPNKDVHSGIFGGYVGNPIHELSRLLALVHDVNNHITIQNFYDGVETSVEDMRSCEENNIDEESIKKELGVKDFVIEKGFSPQQASTLRPTFEVNGIFGGHIAEGGKTIIPRKVTAKISTRLVDKQDPIKIKQYIEKFFAENIHPAFKFDIHSESNGCAATVTNVNFDVYNKLSRYISEVYGKDVVTVRMGGSLPIMNVLAKALGCEIVFFGTSGPDSNCHGPNENLKIDDYNKAIVILVKLVTE